jgi:hypothetical protein
MMNHGVEMATHGVGYSKTRHHRSTGFAMSGCHRTARMKTTTGGDIDGIWRLALQDDAARTRGGVFRTWRRYR